MKRKTSTLLMLTLALTILLSGCGGQQAEAPTESESNTPAVDASTPAGGPVVSAGTQTDAPVSNTAPSGTDLTLRFGGGEEFAIHMYDNATANKIVEYVGTASWQLPIYHFDDYEG